MLKINNKPAKYEPASIIYQYNNSLNPTGLGSVGISVNIDDNKLVFIGIKSDVVKIHTNFGIYDFVNLSQKNIDNITNNKNDFIRLYVDNIVLDVDYVALYNFAYKDNISELTKMSFSETCELNQGAMLFIDPQYFNENDFKVIGVFVNKNTEMLVIDNHIVSKDDINEEIYYSIWKVKGRVIPSSTYNNPTNFIEKMNIKSQYIDSIFEARKDFYGTNNIMKENIMQQPIGLKETVNSFYDLEHLDVLNKNGFYSKDDLFIGDNFYFTERSSYFKNNFIVINNPLNLYNISFDINKNIVYYSFVDFVLNSDRKTIANVMNIDYSETDKAIAIMENILFNDEYNEYIGKTIMKLNALISEIVCLNNITNKSDLINLIVDLVKEALFGFIDKEAVSVNIPMWLLEKENNNVKTNDLYINIVTNPTLKRVLYFTSSKMINKNDFTVEYNKNIYGIKDTYFIWDNIKKEFRRNNVNNSCYGEKYIDLSYPTVERIEKGIDKYFTQGRYVDVFSIKQSLFEREYGKTLTDEIISNKIGFIFNNKDMTQ